MGEEHWGIEGISMNATVIDLAPLYTHAANDLECLSLPLSTKEGRILGKLIKGTLNEVPKSAGFYVWFAADASQPIYVGKASEGKTCNLYARLLEEIKEERGFLWAGDMLGLTENDLTHKWLAHYKERPGTNGGQRHISRSMRKRNSTHIAIIPTPGVDARTVRSLESHLIEILNPTVNVQRGAGLPEHKQRASNLADAFRREIVSA